MSNTQKWPSNYMYRVELQKQSSIISRTDAVYRVLDANTCMLMSYSIDEDFKSLASTLPVNCTQNISVCSLNDGLMK